MTLKQRRCNLCHRGYESEYKIDNLICPICIQKIYGRKSILDRGDSEVNGERVK